MIQADYCGNLALTLTTKIRQVETERLRMKGKRWLRGRDLNPGPQGYEPCELPDCSTPRQ
jgi:hypothetical protein